MTALVLATAIALSSPAIHQTQGRECVWNGHVFLCRWSTVDPPPARRPMPPTTTNSVAANWVVYRIVTHDNPKMEELILQKPQLEQQLLQTKQQASYDAFKTALQNRLKSEGKIVIDANNLKAITGNS